MMMMMMMMPLESVVLFPVSAKTLLLLLFRDAKVKEAQIILQP